MKLIDLHEYPTQTDSVDKKKYAEYIIKAIQVNQDDSLDRYFGKVTKLDSFDVASLPSSRHVYAQRLINELTTDELIDLHDKIKNKTYPKYKTPKAFGE